MNSANQNLGTESAEDASVFIDEVNIFESVSPEVERLREELATERDARLRLAAEYENYRRRTKNELAQAGEAGKQKLLEQLIMIADDFDLAVANLDESSGATADGWRLIHRRFSEMLEANNVTAFNSTGEKFDPELHEAFDIINGTDSEPQTVYNEIRRGYLWNGRLLRPALVVVAQ